ncbi:MAG: hypothetical protein MJA83_00540 [Gammaproteobacteria bacterium]|nr:hypothetical protein [Gammaproteobacteria bacterium]
MSKDDDKHRHLSIVREGESLSDPLAILELLKDAILNKPTFDRSKVSEALRKTLEKYETKNRIFLIAAANAELPRIVRLLEFINSCESAMFNPDRIEEASMKELLRLYALTQSNLLSSLDNVKKVADMRLEFLKAGAGEGGIGNLFEEDKQIGALQDLPGLDPQERDRVRNTVMGLLKSIESDDSLKVSEDEPSEDTTED